MNALRSSLGRGFFVWPLALHARGEEDRLPTFFTIAPAFLAAIPALAIRAGWINLPVEIATACFGAAIVGAAFAMSWGAEASERDIPRALALTVVALLAVFPEYAVDIIFAFKAGQDPQFAPYAAANMTGSNRLLLGLGWPTVAVLAWLVSGRRILHLDASNRVPLAFLALATLYSFTLPVRGSISPLDSVFLMTLFITFAVFAARQETEEPDLVGPAAAIGGLDTPRRRLAIAGLFVFAGLSIGASAEAFAEGLVHTGARLGIDQFLLVQWLAPLASETPEFLVAALLALRGKATSSLSLLLSAKVNQWTLLIGSLAVSYSLGAGHPAALPLDARQSAEVLLTAAQSFFGLAVLASLSFHLAEAGLLAGLFVLQLALGGIFRAGLHDPAAASHELFVFSGVYLLLGLISLVRARGAWVRDRHRGLESPAQQDPRVLPL
jgi:cation:H+ antiporter